MTNRRKNNLLTNHTSHTDYKYNVRLTHRANEVDFTPNKILVAVAVVCLVGMVLHGLGVI